MEGRSTNPLRHETGGSLLRRVLSSGALVLLGFALSAGICRGDPVASGPPVDLPWPATPEAPPKPPTERALHVGGGAPAPLIDILATWQPMGPAPLLSGQCENLPGPNPVTGAVHAVAAHPTDPNRVWIGSVNGGIWRTTNATAASPTWTPLTDSLPSLSVAALELDPMDGSSQTLVAGIGRVSSFGGVGGPLTGLLRTTDGGSTWTQLTDPLLQNESMTAVAERGPVILAAAKVYFQAGGLWRSTNTGGIFTRISGTPGTGLPNGGVFDLAGDPTNLGRFYCSVRQVGIFRSDDTGATWTNVSSSDATVTSFVTNGASNNAEMAVAPAGANAGRMFLSVLWNGQPRYVGFYDPNTGIWTQMDIPQTLEPLVSGAITNASNTTPITITTAAPHGLGTGDGAVISGVTGNTAANGVWPRVQVPAVMNPTTFTMDGSSGNGAYGGGGTFTKIYGANPDEEPGGQGSIHSSLAVDPSNSDLFYLGGDRQDGPFPNSLGSTDFSGRLFRANVSIPPNPTVVPSPQWTSLTNSGTASNSSPHADTRDMAFRADGVLMCVCDGGIYARTSPATSTGDWFSMNGNLQVNEEHDAAYDGVSHIILSGNQDTGTGYQNATGSATWTSRITADGGDVETGPSAVSAGDSDRWFSYQFLGGFEVSTWSPANAFTGSTNPALVLTNPAFMGDSLQAAFYTPLGLNVNNTMRIIIGGSNGIFESLDRGATVTRISNANLNDGGAYDAVAYGGTSGGMPNDDVLYVGTGSQVLLRTTPPGGALNVTAYAGGSVRDIALDPNDWQHAVVVDSGRVYVTTDAGVSYTDITGDLFTAHSPTEIHSVAYIPDATSDGVAVGTQDGVYVSRLVSLGTWARLGSGLPNAGAYTLIYNAADDVLVAGTMGRGAWEVQNVTAAMDMTPPVVTAATARPLLWPPLRGMIDVNFSWSASDNFDPANTLVKHITIYSNEPEPPLAPDSFFALPSTVRLRAERNWPGTGRIYLVLVDATDTSGNTGRACASVVVPTTLTLAQLTSLYMQGNMAAAQAVATGTPPPPFAAINGPTPLP